MIKLKSGSYEVNDWDYFWNGCVLSTVVVKNSSSKFKILETVPKKYYNEIMFSEHEVVKCGVAGTIPQTVKEKAKEKPYILIKMKR